MLLTTLNDDGTVAYEEEVKRRFYPRNGFYKHKNGNFYKLLGDPRNITDIRTIQKLKQMEEEKKRAAEIKATTIVKAHPVNEDAWSGPKQNTKFITCPENSRLSENDLICKYRFETFTRRCSQGIMRLLQVKLPYDLYIPGIANNLKYNKIEINSSTGTGSFWIRKPKDDKELADFVVYNIIIVEMEVACNE